MPSNYSKHLSSDFDQCKLQEKMKIACSTVVYLGNA